MRRVTATIMCVLLGHVCSADQPIGIVGIFVSESDYGLVTSVIHGSPAAAGVAPGDRLLTIGAQELATLKTPEEFRRATSGGVGELVILTIRRARDGSVITLRLQRVAPDTLKPRDIPPDSDMRFFAGGTKRPNQSLEVTATRALPRFS